MAFSTPCKRCGSVDSPMPNNNTVTDEPTGIDEFGHPTYEGSFGLVHEVCLTAEESIAITKMHTDFVAFAIHHREEFWKGIINVSHDGCGCPYEVKS